MDREDLGHLRRFVDTALERGWSPCHGRIEGTFMVLDPLCIRIAVASPVQSVDNDVYIDWLAPLSERQLAQAVWGEKLASDLTVNWRHHQHRLLDLLQTAGVKAYCEYLEAAI